MTKEGVGAVDGRCSGNIRGLHNKEKSVLKSIIPSP